MIPGVGSKDQTFFSERNHVAYQSKGNGARTTIKANILSLCTPSTPGVVSKGQILFSFLKVVMLHIKSKGKKCRPTCKQKLTHTPDLWGWVERSDIEIAMQQISIFFLELRTLKDSKQAFLMI